MNIRVKKIGFASSPTTDEVLMTITLMSSNRSAKFTLLIDFGIPHSDCSTDNLRLGKEVLLGADAKDVEINPYDDDGYPTVSLEFPVTAFFHNVSSAPSAWTKGFGMRDMGVNFYPEKSYRGHYKTWIIVPFALAAYLNGKLKHFHKDEL